MNWYSLLALANAMSCSSTCDRLTSSRYTSSSSSARNGQGVPVHLHIAPTAHRHGRLLKSTPVS